MILHNIGLLDNEEGTRFEAFTATGDKYTEIKGQGGDNSAEVVSFASDGLPGVIQLKITMNGSGAISFVEVQKASEVVPAVTDAPTKGPTEAPTVTPVVSKLLVLLGALRTVQYLSISFQTHWTNSCQPKSSFDVAE